MNLSLRKRIFPNQSICLRPPTAHAPDDVLCQCPICNQLEHKKKLQLLKVQQSHFKKKLQSKLQSQFISSSLNCDSDALEWLMNRLILPTHKIINRGIDIFIPQTLFYKDGEPMALLMNKEIHDCKIKKVKRQKINHTLIQKIMNERRRKYRDQVQILLGQKVLEKKKSLFAKKQPRIDTKDAAVIQFTDKSQQLITENQLINLMLKRKQDSIWKKILMIKNFVSAKQSSRLVKLSFDYKTPLYPDLFARTKTLMLIYGDNIQESQMEYISEVEEERFCTDLLRSSIEIFAEYCLYKIVSFVEYFYDDKIDKIECSILVNEFNRPYLLDVFKLESKELVKYVWTQDEYKKKIQFQENRIFKNDKPLSNLNPEAQTIVKTLEECMYQKYLEEKDKNGLTLDPEDTTEEQNNDRFFAFLYPQFKKDLSHVLRTQNLSIIDMKKKYLGYVEEKKPIVKPFASSFVKTLHSLTPRVRLSQDRRLSLTIDKERNLGIQTFRSRKVSTPLVIDKKFRSLNKSTLDYIC